MHRLTTCRPLFVLIALAAWTLSEHALGAVPNSFILNEVNAVSGGKYLENGSKDAAFSSAPVEGNGQNWMEFLVVQGDAAPGGGYKNTLDLRGWTINWSFEKSDHTSSGSGVIQFTQDPLWAAVPRGTMLTISEWSDVWYNKNTGKRAGGYNGLGNNPLDPFNSNDFYIGSNPLTPSVDPHIYATNTSWNPGANGDWNIHIFAGDTPAGPLGQFKYFNFTGSTTDGTIGTNAGGLFVANNDNWQYTIKDQAGNTIQGPYGEALSGGAWAVNSMEMIKLEGAFDRFQGDRPQSDYLSIGINDLNDGNESTFGKENSWNDGGNHQGLGGLRDWLHTGDSNLDGGVGAADFVMWRKNANTSSSDWRLDDFNGDGSIDTGDYAAWRSHFDDGTAASASVSLDTNAVPEPQSFALLAAGLAALFVRRKCRNGCCKS